MKIRPGFVSNSSSTAFIITNITNEPKTLVDFVEENPHLVGDFVREYDWYQEERYAGQFTKARMLENAKQRMGVDEVKGYTLTSCGYTWAPGESKECIFGDEQGDLIGQVYDYMLRAGGKSDSFVWHFHEWHR